MKKLLSLVLVLSLLVGTMSVSFAAPADVENKDQMEAVDVLMALDVVDGYEDGTYKPGKVVTRAEMAKLMVAILGYSDLAVAKTSSFSDMKGHWSVGYVEMCTSINIIKGYPDGTFRPDAPVSYEEAVTMIVRGFGYTDDVLVGSWPSNYLAKAQDLGIFDNVSKFTGGANRGDVAVMLFNALIVSIGTVDQDGSYVPNVIIRDGKKYADTMLDRLKGNKLTDRLIYGSEDALFSLRKYVAQWSEVYTNKDNDIILVRDAADMNAKGKFNEKTAAVSEVKVDGVTYSAKPSLDGDGNSIKYFLNGEYNAPYATLSAMLVAVSEKEYTISADYEGKTIKDIYSASRWEVTAAGMFDEDDAADIEEDDELFDISFELDDEKEINLEEFELMGVDSLDAIEEDDVVYVYAGNDKTTNDITRVTVGTEVVTGEISKINSDGDEFTIDGTTYEQSSAPGAKFETVKVEDEVKLSLDYDGDIYKMEVVESDKNFAVVLEIGSGAGAGLTGYAPEIKMFLEDGSDQTFEVDYKDVDKGKNAANATIDLGFFNGDAVAGTTNKTWTAGALSAGDVVEYALNDDGEVDDITVLISAGAATVKKDITDKGYFNGRELKSAAVGFGFDGAATATDRADEDNYSVIDRDSLVGLKDTVAAYSVDGNQIEVMIINDYDSGDDVYALVEDYASIAGDDFEVTFYIDGEKVVYEADKSASPVALDGDSNMYLLDFNAAGEVEGYTAVDGVGTVKDTTAAAISVVDMTINIDGNTLTLGGTDFTMDSDVTIYMLKTNGDYKVKSKRDLEQRDQDGVDKVVLYDVIDNDGVFDTVIYFD